MCAQLTSHYPHFWAILGDFLAIFTEARACTHVTPDIPVTGNPENGGKFICFNCTPARAVEAQM